MKINILIRTSFRPELFKRCIESVRRQTYQNIRVIVGYDRPEAKGYLPQDLEAVEMKPESGKYFYNKYCNQLKELVTDGWFFFLDDDDYLLNPKVLQRISQYLFDGCLIVQFIRANGRPKPKSVLMDAKKIEVGHIGLPCIILHHKFKNVSDLDGDDEFGDYTFIKKVSERVPTKFVSEPVVVAERRSWGRIYLSQQ